MMAFFNIETTSPNVFLMSQDHDGTCFCEQCRTARLAGLSTKSIQLLRRDVMNSLPTQKKTKENTLFATTLKEIVAGKEYKNRCLLGTRYSNFASWAKTQPMYHRFSTSNNFARQKEFKDHCKYINDAAICFDNWNTIITNLTDQRITHINARTFPVGNFAHAKSMEWCLSYNIKCGGARPDDIGNVGLDIYNQTDVTRIFRKIVDDGILDQIEHDPKTCASFAHQLSLRMIRYCRLKSNEI